MRCEVLLLILLVPSQIVAASCDPVIVVSPGGVAIEAERGLPPEGWSLEQDIAGHVGDGYLRWSAPNSYAVPGSGLLAYRFVITKAGRYHIRLRVNTAGAERRDLGNDVFTRCNGGNWNKTFIGGGSPHGWSIRTRLEPEHGKFAEAVYDLDAGMQTFEISGRSHGLRLDRILIWRDGEKEPNDTIVASSGLPPIPSEVDDPMVRDAWAKGSLGAVWIWATKRSKHPGSKPALTALLIHAEAQLAELTRLRSEQVMVAVELLEILCAQYQGSEPGRDLKKTLRDWTQDPVVMSERKAEQAIIAIEPAIAAFRRLDDTPQKTQAAQQLAAVLRKIRTRYPDTQAVTSAISRLQAIGVTID